MHSTKIFRVSLIGQHCSGAEDRAMTKREKVSLYGAYIQVDNCKNYFLKYPEYSIREAGKEQ